MQITEQAQTVTSYIGENDKWNSNLLYLAMSEKLKSEDFAGTRKHP